MKPATLGLLTLFVLLSAGGIFWISRYQPGLPTDETRASENGDSTEGAKKAEKEEPIPEVVRTGPRPNAVVEDLEYDFGVMLAGSESKHTFTLKNDGESALILVAREKDRSCHCTSAELSHSELPPGETAEVTLSWQVPAKHAPGLFSHSAIVRTNDLNNSEIKFVVRGQIEEAVVLEPRQHWSLGMLFSDRPTEFTGTIHSGIYDNLEVIGFESTSDLLTAEAIPMSPDDLKERKAKSGYVIKATMQPGTTSGTVSEKLTIRTNIKDGAEFVIYLRGHRAGPISFTGPGWIAGINLLELSRINADQGIKHTSTMIVRGIGDEDFRIESVETDPPFLKISAEPKQRLGTKNQMLNLSIEIPPGSPRVARPREDPAIITLKTNHPQAETIKIGVQFVTY